MIQEILLIKIRWWKIALLCMTLVVLSCSLEPEKKEMKYESVSEKTLPLEVPPDLTEPVTENRYIVPDIKPTESKTYSAYSKERTIGDKAEGSAPLLPVTSDDSMVRIERSGTQRWLVVKIEPETVWLIVKDFWKEMGFSIKIEVPEAGVMETGWAENRAGIPGYEILRLFSAIEFDKFRTRLERGEDAGTTEIYISHRAMEDRPSDPDLEVEILARLMIYFGVDRERTKSVLASSSTKERAHLNRKKGNVLTVDEAFDRSWRRVGLALDRIGFTVEDRDRSKGIYFVRYVDPDSILEEDEDSFWAFWRGGDNDEKKPDKYRIQVSGVEIGSEVTIFNQNGEPEKSDVAGRILNLLYEQLK